LKITWLIALALLASSAGAALAQEDKKTDDLKPADPDTGESTVEESTLGLLPNPFQKYGIKFAATYIGETLGNVSGGLKQGAIYEGRLNLAIDVDLQKLARLQGLTFHANLFQIPWRRAVPRQSAELSDRQRHRGAAVNAIVRDVVRAEVGRQGQV
jgi:hypothetical protein